MNRAWLVAVFFGLPPSLGFPPIVKAAGWASVVAGAAGRLQVQEPDKRDLVRARNVQEDVWRSPDC